MESNSLLDMVYRFVQGAKKQMEVWLEGSQAKEGGVGLPRVIRIPARKWDHSATHKLPFAERTLI